MDEDELYKTPSQSHMKSFLNATMLNDNHVDSGKKRKLQAEVLGLPISKHKCSFQGSTPSTSFDKDLQTENFNVVLLKGKSEAGDTCCSSSQQESMEGSNSFAGYSDAAISAHDKVKVQPEYASIYSIPSSFSVSWGSSSSQNSSDNTMIFSGVGEKENEIVEIYPSHDDQHIRLHQIIEEHLLDYGNNFHHPNMEFGNNCMDQCADKEIEEILYSDEVYPSNYILSSGRWSIDRDDQKEKRKPTIDQEFEQYFSMLML